jgi:hypothetical protein
MRIFQNFSVGTEENNETSPPPPFPRKVAGIEISARGPPKYYNDSTTTFGNLSGW